MFFKHYFYFTDNKKKQHKIVGETKLNAQSYVNLKKLIMHEQYLKLRRLLLCDIADCTLLKHSLSNFRNNPPSHV